jgi:hypothetical protein
MSVIPLDLQRRFEQRWAARFTVPGAVIVPKNAALKSALRKGRRARQKKLPPPFAKMAHP